MAREAGERTLVWGVIGLMIVAAVMAWVVTNTTPGTPPGANQPPVAVLSPKNVSINLGESVNFTGADSKDPDGTIRAFAWDFGDGYSATGAIVQHQYEITGAFRVRLEVTDDKGVKNASTTSVWVNLNQQIPFGSASWTRQPPTSTPSTVAFPVDANATRAVFHLELNTTTPSGTRAAISVLDPNGAVVYETSVNLSAGVPATPLDFTLPGENLTVYGQWTLRVEAQPRTGTQLTASVGFSGTVRVEYKPA